MICPPCRSAGMYNALKSGEEPSWAIGISKDHAAELHEQCKGGTWCCCQHKLGDYKNRRTDG